LSTKKLEQFEQTHIDQLSEIFDSTMQPLQIEENNEKMMEKNLPPWLFEKDVSLKANNDDLYNIAEQYAGKYVNGKDKILTLLPDGTMNYSGDDEIEYFYNSEYDITYRRDSYSFERHDDGHFTWGQGLITIDGMGIAASGSKVWLFPVGVEICFEGAHYPTDITRIRLWSAQDFSDDMARDIYYFENTEK